MMAELDNVAVLVDGAFLGKHIETVLNPPPPTTMAILPPRQYPKASHFIEFAESCVNAAFERLFRIYFYDCFPFGGQALHPLYRGKTHFRNQYYWYRYNLLKDIAQHDHVAFRSGFIQLIGWKLKDTAVGALIAGKQLKITPQDIMPDFKQKCVDMKIGLDVAWLSNKRIVEKIILISNDRDFIPPMKHARREGVKVIMAELPALYRIMPELREHADEIRILKQDPSGTYKFTIQ